MAATLTDREALITLHQPPGSRNFEPRGRLKHNLETSALNLWNNSYTREEMKGWDGRLKMYATHSLFSRLAFVFHVVQYEVLPSPLTSRFSCVHGFSRSLQVSSHYCVVSLSIVIIGSELNVFLSSLLELIGFI